MVIIQLERQPAMDIVVTVPQEILAQMEDMETLGEILEEDMEVLVAALEEDMVAPVAVLEEDMETPEEDMEVTDTYCEEVL